MKSVFLVLTIVGIYTISTQAVYGQRVYADAQQTNTTPLVGSVSNPTRSVDSDYTNYSTLNVILGVLGTGFSSQNLQFTGTLKPKPTSPLMIRFGSGGSILGLLDGIQVQRTNGGVSGTIGDPYSSDTLLDLLGLIGGEEPSEVTVPIPGEDEPSDGVRLRISNALLGLAFSADLYYAFFITPPNIESSTVSVCQGESALVSISNFQSGYTYRIYDALTEGNLLYSGTEDVL